MAGVVTIKLANQRRPLPLADRPVAGTRDGDLPPLTSPVRMLVILPHWIGPVEPGSQLAQDAIHLWPAVAFEPIPSDKEPIGGYGETKQPLWRHSGRTDPVVGVAERFAVVHAGAAGGLNRSMRRRMSANRSFGTATSANRRCTAVRGPRQHPNFGSRDTISSFDASPILGFLGASGGMWSSVADDPRFFTAVAAADRGSARARSSLCRFDHAPHRRSACEIARSR